jgi:hypothetical protein
METHPPLPRKVWEEEPINLLWSWVEVSADCEPLKRKSRGRTKKTNAEQVVVRKQNVNV